MWFWSSKLFYMSTPYHWLAPIWPHYVLRVWFCFSKPFNKSTISLGLQFDVIKFCGCDFHCQNPLMMHFDFVAMKFNVCDLEIQRQFWWIMIWKSRHYEILITCLCLNVNVVCVWVLFLRNGKLFRSWWIHVTNSTITICCFAQRKTSP